MELVEHCAARRHPDRGTKNVAFFVSSNLVGGLREVERVRMKPKNGRSLSLGSVRERVPRRAATDGGWKLHRDLSSRRKCKAAVRDATAVGLNYE